MFIKKHNNIMIPRIPPKIKFIELNEFETFVIFFETFFDTFVETFLVFSRRCNLLTISSFYKTIL